MCDIICNICKRIGKIDSGEVFMADKSKLSRKITQDKFVTEKIDVIKNNLLGSYDDDGNYNFASQIISELIHLNKVKKTTFGNSVFCVGNLLGYGELVFELLFDSKTHNGKSASATLYLLEDVDKINGYLQNTIKTKIEDFSEEVENFIEETYNHFNIHNEEDDDEDEGRERKLLDDLDSEDSFIVAKKQFSLLLDKLLDEKFLDAYGKYFTSRISILTKLENGFSKAVLESFNNQYKMIENIFLQEKNYKTLNELLDKCIEEVSGTNEQFIAQEKEFTEQTSSALETFVDSVNKLNNRFEQKALHMLDEADREKVEEILDEQVVQQDSNTYESKPSVEQMVNDVQKPKEKEPVKSESEPKEKVNEEVPQKRDQTENIMDMLEKKKVAEQREKPTQQQSFYDAFRGAHVTQKTALEPAPEKVVDTTISRGVDTPESEGGVAVVSLKDRIKRLEKFKSTEPLELSDSNSFDNVYDNLARERRNKDVQVEEKNARTRTLLAEEYLKRQQSKNEKVNVDEREL